MRGLALGVSIAAAAASGAAAQDFAGLNRTQDFSGHQALQDVVIATPGSKTWPIRLKLAAKHFDIGLAPRLAIGDDQRAEAGAEVRLGFRHDPSVAERLDELGVRDGAHFGEKGRWYLFATASGRSVGLNMLRSEQGWDQGGWTTDQTSALIGDAQAGLGWRRGSMQASVGYVHREIKNAYPLLGQDGRKDSLLAFSLSIKPR